MEKRLRSSLQSSAEEFLSLAQKQSLKSSKPILKSLIHKITPNSDLSSSLPTSLHRSISHSIESFQKLLQPNPRRSPNPSPSKPPPTKRHRRSSRHSKTPVEPEPDRHEFDVGKEKKKLLKDLEILAHIAVLCVTHPKKAFSPSDLLPGVRALHDNLILFDSDSVLLSEIANLCEEWWKENLPGRETLISQSLPFLLSKSLTLKRKVDLHRVYSLREAFVLFDYDDESIEDLKLLLIRCVIAPLYLKTDDGRRFLAFVFGLSNQLVKEMLAMIRSQIPFGRKSMLEAFGDILFRAWKAAEGDCKDELENGFLQGLIDGAIHASSPALAASIRRVLGGFISQRTTEGVEKLLFRLTEPVIFRSLQVANSNVRQNALHLLLDMFPLEDPDSTKEVKDTLLDKQFFLLERLLADDCPDVRVVAVEGSCRILHLFWEIIPSASITKTITKIFDDMSHDICIEVRLSTLNGIIYLLGNPQSHEILKVLLPRLGHLMLDNAVSTRAAVADLLLLIRDIRNFQFHKVVGLDVLLSTLANDQPLVAQKITKLLIPSYFPSKVPVEEACSRCITLIKRSPMAGARFCEFAVSEGASFKSLMELFRVFISLILSPDKLDADQMEGLLVAASYLCNSLASEPCYKRALNKLLDSEKVKFLFAAASTACAQSSVIKIVSTISPDDAAGLFEECMGLVTNCSGISDNVERQAEVRSAHKLFLSCDGFDDMFEALTVRLQKTAYRCHIKFGTEIPKNSFSSTKRKKSMSSGKISAKWKCVGGKKAFDFEKDYSIAVGIAWQIRDLLIAEDSRKAILGSQTLELSFIALKIISEVSIMQCMHCEYMDTSPILAYTVLALHMTLQNVSINGQKNCGTRNNSTDSSRSLLELTVLEQTMDHMLNCTEKLLGAGDSGNYSKLPSELGQANSKTASSHRRGNKEPQTDSSPSAHDSPNIEQKRVLIIVKMLTASLKFMVDAAMMGFLCHYYGQLLKFTSRYVQYIISALGQQSQDRFQFEEEDLKDIVVCVKSSFTYAAKSLNLVHRAVSEASPLPPEAFDVANNLLDLITSIELHLGSGKAASLVAAAKPWLPDLILALGSGNILKETQGEGIHFHASDRIKVHFPSWLLSLARTELSEMSEVSPEKDDDGRVSESEDFLVFKKLLGMIVTLLKGNPNVLDAVGVIFLTGSVVGLERKDFGLVLGLLHFVCMKLFSRDDKEWGGMMLASLQEIYPQIERELEEENDEDGRQKLLSAKELLEPVWMYHIYETGRVTMMEE